MEEKSGSRVKASGVLRAMDGAAAVASRLDMLSAFAASNVSGVDLSQMDGLATELNSISSDVREIIEDLRSESRHDATEGAKGEEFALAWLRLYDDLGLALDNISGAAYVLDMMGDSMPTDEGFALHMIAATLQDNVQRLDTARETVRELDGHTDAESEVM